MVLPCAAATGVFRAMSQSVLRMLNNRGGVNNVESPFAFPLWPVVRAGVEVKKVTGYFMKKNRNFLI